MKLGKSLSKSEQRMILGGDMPVQCQLDGGCPCPNGGTFSPIESCDSCSDTSTGYDCYRNGEVWKSVTCSSYEASSYCEPT